MSFMKQQQFCTPIEYTESIKANNKNKKLCLTSRLIINLDLLESKLGNLSKVACVFFCCSLVVILVVYRENKFKLTFKRETAKNGLWGNIKNTQ